MPLEVATHNGSFHADDVLAFALIRAFVDSEATLIRTRDLARIATADIAIDVGGEFDPSRRRFDHHQASYDGPRSSAGMVLDWLEAEERITAAVAVALRRDLVDHVDAIDNGRIAPESGVPCFSTLITFLNNTATDPESLLSRFHDAAEMASQVARGIRAGCEQLAAARTIVHEAMAAAVRNDRAVLFLEEPCDWKPAYFENGGIDHPTDFVLLPADESWRIVAIPPELGSFDKKRPLPEDWAGLVDDELTARTGIEGSKFCHKNRFVAVFATRGGAIAALEKFGLMRRSTTDRAT